MAIVNPFCAIRPAPEKVAQVATHSVERYTGQQIQEILADNPFSFLNVIYTGGAEKEEYSAHLMKVRKKLDDFITQKIYTKDQAPSFYLYRQIKDGRHHIGIMGLASVEDYDHSKIRIHEQTLEKKELKLTEYLDICEFNAEPVCLTYPHHAELNAIMHSKMKSVPVYDYEVDSTRHTVWTIADIKEVGQIREIFGSIPILYIADGHHRAASSARLARQRKNDNPLHTGNEPYNFFTAAIFADDELTIHNYNRMVSDLNRLDVNSFLAQLGKKFEVKLHINRLSESECRGEICLYLEHNWYSLFLKSPGLHGGDVVSGLDVSILSDEILSPLLHIKDLRNDKRIAFIPGIKSLKEVMSYVDSGKMAAAFCLHPVTFKELIEVADSGKEMPPKSTWIEPKLESGLLIYDFHK